MPLLTILGCTRATLQEKVVMVTARAAKHACVCPHVRQLSFMQFLRWGVLSGVVSLGAYFG